MLISLFLEARTWVYDQESDKLMLLPGTLNLERIVVRNLSSLKWTLLIAMTGSNEWNLCTVACGDISLSWNIDDGDPSVVPNTEQHCASLMSRISFYSVSKSDFLPFCKFCGFPLKYLFFKQLYWGLVDIKKWTYLIEQFNEFENVHTPVKPSLSSS